MQARRLLGDRRKHRQLRGRPKRVGAKKVEVSATEKECCGEILDRLSRRFFVLCVVRAVKLVLQSCVLWVR